MQVERKLGGRLLDNPKQILFQYGGGNLCMTIEELDPAWRCKSTTNYQVKSYDACNRCYGADGIQQKPVV